MSTLVHRSTQVAATPGWCGKLASLGDFAHRRLPPACVEVCDTWLSRVMLNGSRYLGERWLHTYLTAPLLRFAWAPGVLDRQWWFGLLMPSCDSVGRYFPLLIAQARLCPPLEGIALDHLERWYAHLARAALQTLSDHNSIDNFEHALHETPPWPTSGQTTRLSTRSTPMAERHHVPPASPLSHWLPALAANELLARVAGCSLWWRVVEDGSAASVSVVHRLPDAETFLDLLRG